ncbi:hypothetical protein LUU34_01560000 [Aix galericulata]|nr:hypothetical protein LUU34_01560000 [Aix galericulata]
MSPQSCAAVCLSLTLVGRNLGFLVEIPQDAVTGTVGQSVLLPVSYRCNSTSCFPMSIKWTFDHPLQRTISCVVLNCSLDDGGAPKYCSKKCYPYPAYWGRVELFPENASLLLQDLQLSDSGVYNVSFLQHQRQSRHITLTVLEQPVPTEPSSNSTSEGAGRIATCIPCCILGGCYCFILLLLQLLFHLCWLRGGRGEACGCCWGEGSQRAGAARAGAE